MKLKTVQEIDNTLEWEDDDRRAEPTRPAPRPARPRVGGDARGAARAARHGAPPDAQKLRRPDDARQGPLRVQQHLLVADASRAAILTSSSEVRAVGSAEKTRGKINLEPQTVNMTLN